MYMFSPVFDWQLFISEKFEGDLPAGLLRVDESLVYSLTHFLYKAVCRTKLFGCRGGFILQPQH